MYRRPLHHFDRGCDEFVLVNSAPGNTDDDGEWVSGSETRHDLKGDAAPLPEGTARRTLPDGARISGAYQFWFVRPEGVEVSEGSQGTDQNDGSVPSRVEYEGNLYQVVSMRRWEPYYAHVFCTLLP